MKGVISLLVASIFLLSLVSSAAEISRRAPDFSYQPLFAMATKAKAVKSAFSDALSEASGKALAASQASGADAPSALRVALHLSALDFDRQMQEGGHGAVLWCGKAGEQARQEASGRMAEEGRAFAPEGTLPISNPQCADEFSVNLLRGKAVARHIGFSIYSYGLGYAMQLPENYEVGIGGGKNA